MNRNFIDFPPWRKSRGLLQDLPLLAQDLVIAPQPLGCHILLAVLGRIIDLALAAAVDPVAQGRRAAELAHRIKNSLQIITGFPAFKAIRRCRRGSVRSPSSTMS